jgi:hypothetical protein
MQSALRIWVIGAINSAFQIASIVFNILFATSVTQVASVDAIRILSFVSLALSALTVVGLLYLSTYHVLRLRNRPSSITSAVWWYYIYAACVAFVSLTLTGVVLIWSVARSEELPDTLSGLDAMTLLGLWFGAWGLSLLAQLALSLLLGLWTRDILKAQSVGRLDLDFGIRLPPMEEIRPATQDTQRSFPSQDITLHSPPRTPTSRGAPSSIRSSATRVGTGSSRIKLVKGSARSSLEIQPFPAGEAVSIDSAFDTWDTSSVHREMRMVAMTSSPPTRSGLETIPGSRSESPADADGLFLPPSPTMYAPHAASSETAEALGWYPTSPFRRDSTPPSSPPNFSRPTSRPTSSHQKTTLAPAFGADSSMQDLIHPLFRPNSPEPPPLAVVGTMVTASPLASQPITPKTLARIRGNSAVGHWKAMPSVDKSERPSTAGSIASSVGFGSPGPSIVDGDEDLPPTILPGFVLSAGQRTSLVGYGKRKSVKRDRPKSQLSAGSRLSQLML